MSASLKKISWSIEYPEEKSNYHKKSGCCFIKSIDFCISRNVLSNK